MGEIKLAIAASHAPGLTALFDPAPADARQVVTRAYGALREKIRAAELDVLIMIGNDHLANSRIRDYPDFLVGLAAEHSGPAEYFRDLLACGDYTVRGDTRTAEAVFNGLINRGVRASARRTNLNFDDNISIPIVVTGLDKLGVPIIPILQNCIVPPVPDQRRCYEVGQVLGKVIADQLPDGLRVGLFATGGMSHEPGGARDFWIDEEFDRWFLDLLTEGDHERILREVTLERLDAAGAGGTAELLSWILVMGAIGERPCAVHGYTSWEQWRCGIGAVSWDMAPVASPREGDMGMQTLNTALVTHDLVQDLKWDASLRQEFLSDSATVLDRYDLTPEERRAIDEGDFRTLYGLGMHPYLGLQFARVVFRDNKNGGTGAVRALLASIHEERDPAGANQDEVQL